MHGGTNSNWDNGNKFWNIFCFVDFNCNFDKSYFYIKAQLCFKCLTISTNSAKETADMGEIF